MNEHTVGEADHDIRLDRWFKRHYPGLQHSLLEKHLRKGIIRVDGAKAKTSDRIYMGQVVMCPKIEGSEMPKPKRNATPEDLKAIKDWVLYKDDNVIVINKPFGLAVQGGSKITRSVDDLLDGLMFNSKERPKLTHRLDRDTSGVLVLARNAKAAALLMRLFSDRKIEKTYWALVNGSPLPPFGVINAPLLKKETPRAHYGHGTDFELVQVDEKEGQKATTEFKVIDSLARRFAFMELKPLTGRMHQLRVHMAYIACPIVGDHKYGGGTEDAKALGVENILHLHARRIVIPGFNGGKKIDVTAPLPAHMKKSFQALGLDIPKK